MNYLFGSRVRGNHRADSDADVSIQADIPQIASLTEQNILGKPTPLARAAANKRLIIVTGAIQGGKTTFLRSLGLAQLMTQSGMFAPAASLQLNVVDGVFTHFKREEDATMKSGKFDEELSRMNDVVNILTPHALILFNAAANEREGSEIARQIVSALLERSHKIVFVSHQFAFTHGLFERRLDSTLFLRADRLDDGRRTFKLIEGEPLGTSFGEDVYREIFLAGADTKKEASSRAGIMLEDDRTPWGRIDPAQ